jgi:hypothetical protein
VSFILPKTDDELADYRNWLTELIGPCYRFCDGWGHKIVLELGSGTTGPILSARSAGPDGKWRTDDDIVLQRNVDTGRIVFRQGFGTANDNKSSPK